MSKEVNYTLGVLRIALGLIFLWAFFGLLLIGLVLVLGIVVNLASYSGVLLLFLMWLASLPLEHHLFLDEHIIYLIVLLLITFTNAGDYLGFGKEWKKLVKKNKWLN